MYFYPGTNHYLTIRMWQYLTYIYWQQKDLVVIELGKTPLEIFSDTDI